MTRGEGEKIRGRRTVTEQEGRGSIQRLDPLSKGGGKVRGERTGPGKLLPHGLHKARKRERASGKSLIEDTKGRKLGGVHLGRGGGNGREKLNGQGSEGTAVPDEGGGSQ